MLSNSCNVKKLCSQINLPVTSEIIKEETNQEYSAYMFESNNLRVKYRRGKVTPKKSGYFVAIYKKVNNKNQSLEIEDLDLLVVECKSDNLEGCFIFPKSVLINQGIIKSVHKGKMAFRIYPPWVNVSSKQAAVSQQWQNKYFRGYYEA